MKSFGKNSIWIRVTVIMFFLVHFVYFLMFNCYHLFYQEQTQLFLINGNYFSSFLLKPGGLSAYLGAFFTQFYQGPYSAALIVTLFAIAVFFVTAGILRRYTINNILWSLIPVILLASLQSSHLYLLETTIGLLISWFFFLLYISISKHNYRYTTGLIGCSVLYFITGGFALLVFVLCVIHELVFSTSPHRFIVSLGYILLSFLIPVISSRLIYFVNGEEIWLSLFPLQLKRSLLPFLYSIIIYLPLLLILSKFRNMITMKRPHPGGNWRRVLTGIMVISSLLFCFVKFAYDPKTEIVLTIDHYVQEGDWKKALEYSFIYPGSNQLVLYFGNMAMHKTGQMGDKMFHLPQAGVRGLWLEWKRNEVAPFFGGELFYQLGYNSEAYRWAFEAMEARGENPRSLKRLVITSLIDGNISLAQHYINILNETLFYRKWAHYYQNMLNNPGLLNQNREITEKHHYRMHTDIFADQAGNDIGLLQLLHDHPDNRMAFEYYMAWLLLNRDLDTFAANVYRLKDLGYSRIPVHYEEAMLVYMSHTKKNIVPEGYKISAETINHLSGYLKIVNSSGSNMRLASQSLFKNYGGTYWFYLNFVNISGQREAANTAKY